MFPNNPRIDPSSRRRRRHRRHDGLKNVATAAVVVYGAYRLCTWAYSTLFSDDDDGDGDARKDGYDHRHDDDNGDENGGDLLEEWTDDQDEEDEMAREGLRAALGRDILEEEGLYRRHYNRRAHADEQAIDDIPSFIGDVVANDEGGGMTTMMVEDGDHDGGDVDRDGGDAGGTRGGIRPSFATTDTVASRRSRRSRVRWGYSGRHDDRSHRPSPPQDYQHHGHHHLSPNDGLDGTTATSPTTTSIIDDDEYDRERHARMLRCRHECSRAMMDFLPTLRMAIARGTDFSSETAELRRLRERRKGGGAMADDDDDEDAVPEREICLWNDIKDKSMTRLITTVYAHTLIFLTLNVQVNLLGGRLLREEQEEGEGGATTSVPSTTTAADRYRSSHQTVLSKTYHRLFAEGIPSMIESVRNGVHRALRDVDVLFDDATSEDVSAWLKCVRDNIEGGRVEGGGMEDGRTRDSALARFIIPPEESVGGIDDDNDDRDGGDDASDKLARYILDETYDLLESPAFASAERACLDATFDGLRTRVLGSMFDDRDRVPIVSVVTFMQKTAVSTFHKPPSHRDEMKHWGGILGLMEEPLPSAPNDYISQLEELGEVQDLSHVCF